MKIWVVERARTAQIPRTYGNAELLTSRRTRHTVSNAQTTGTEIGERLYF